MWNQLLEKLDTFKYLDTILSFYDIDWHVVDQNLQREHRKWVLSKVLLSIVTIGLLH